MVRRAIIGLVVLLAVSCQKELYTVVVSLDGNRWDYPEYYDTPFLDSLAQAGVSARMEPSYPASTFPNHYTLATGLVPDHNGLVNNSFWDPDTRRSYSMGDRESRYDPYFYLGEPIWVTAEKQGVTTASLYWVGSDIAAGGGQPTYWRNWDEQPHWNFQERVDEAVRLLSLPKEERPRLTMVYFDEPDHTGHVYGPISPECKDVVEQLDALMHSFYLRLKALPHGDRINFIVLADHGMTALDARERFLSYADYLPQEWILRVKGHTPTSIWAKEGYADSLYNHLSKIEHLSVWRHGEVPEYLNYGSSNRLGEVIAAPDLGWQFNQFPSKNLGGHGYDPTEKDMMVVFRATGPSFKKGYEAPFTEGEQSAFHNTDIYPLLCKLLGVKPQPTDGRLERIQKILK